MSIDVDAGKPVAEAIWPFSPFSKTQALNTQALKRKCNALFSRSFGALRDIAGANDIARPSEAIDRDGHNSSRNDPLAGN
jgi:hypothetical protein